MEKKCDETIYETNFHNKFFFQQIRMKKKNWMIKIQTKIFQDEKKINYKKIYKMKNIFHDKKK